jgi:hypothetical protein
MPVTDKEKERPGKGSQVEKKNEQEPSEGHQHAQKLMATRERGATHRRRRVGQKMGNLP